ncbi:hypothetical protein D3H65_01605 [Paraflavitalea soli]|uniref:Uncharacterized protein n=1 Tax=Paraflavitalea soli TaxID=2315862 RepID=A0A3B7MEI7_9BACT|nr:hypothetical protein [Paraflavitalea soli]AXY72744.1 hypothetical protein D3H65_01605 [Paraflavitalea soli]
MQEQHEKGGRGPIIITPQTMARLEAVCSINTGSDTGAALAKQFKDFIKGKLKEDLLGKVPAEEWSSITKPKREELYRQFELFTISGRSLERAKEGKPLKRSSFFLLEEVIRLYLKAYEVTGSPPSNIASGLKASTAPTEKPTVPGETSASAVHAFASSFSPTSSSPPFSPATINTLSLRAAGLCSNPSCLRLTAGPSLSNPAKVHQFGVACLIRGVQEGDPRYDAGQAELRPRHDDIENGIWLCAHDALLVNKEEETYTAELLMSWKQAHEEVLAAWLEGRKRVSFSMNQEEEEPAAAAAIIELFDQQEVLYAQAGSLSKENITVAVENMRTLMLGQATLVLFDGRLELLLNAINRSCEAFLHLARHCDFAMLEIGLAALKKAIGMVLHEIATHYKIALPARVRTITPDNNPPD